MNPKPQREGERDKIDALMKKIKFEELTEGKPYYFETPTIFRQWCCNCKMAHLWLIEIIDNKVCLRLFLDNKASELRKFYEKIKKSIK